MSEIAPGVFDNRDEAKAVSPDHRLMELAREIMQERGCSWDEAWNMALDENPELKTLWTKFLHSPSPRGHIDLIPPQKLRTESVNELASKERAAGCDRIVKAIQAADPDVSYHDAWLKAKAEHRQLFEGPVAVSDKCDVLLAKLDAIEQRNNNGAVRVVSIRQEI